jgi:hypothetical protein
VKDGLRHNKHRDIQKYNCRECDRYFTINFGFQRMGATPQIITSSLQLYFTISNPRTKNIRHVRWQADQNNNKMERLNGEIRDREKVMRGLKKADTAILPGYQIYHNYMRPHEGLNGKTPAELCGIKTEGANKWKTVIENASKSGSQCQIFSSCRACKPSNLTHQR